MESMAGGRLWAYFHGLWTFKRQVRTLQPPHRLLASISSGQASFTPWVCTPDTPEPDRTSPAGVRKRETSEEGGEAEWTSPAGVRKRETSEEGGEAEWTSPAGVRKRQASEEGSASLRESPSRQQQQQVKQPSLLYREQGMLNNHESDLSPATLVNRQYLYCFPGAGADRPLATEISVYHCSAKDRSAAVLDPYTVPGSPLSCCFSPGQHFHDLRFPDVDEGGQGELGAVRSQCTHYCDPDVYEGEFSIQDQAVFSICWMVTGPHKSFSIETNYVKKLS